MRHFFSCLFICFLFHNSHCQNVNISGVVIDSVTTMSIAYAAVGLKEIGIGTITNTDGRFSLVIPSSATQKNLTISFLGYKRIEITISALSKNNVFKLKPDPLSIREVVILPDDAIRILLYRAFKAIPNNYPDKPMMYQGFYREVKRANDTLNLNFIEAILDVYKNTYTNNHNYGQIRVVQSRKNTFPGIDTINNVNFYGGPHFPHTYDFVFSRSSFINPKYYKRYKYKLLDVIRNETDSIYVIGFSRNDDTIQSGYSGKLFIETKSLAYIGAEIKESGEVRRKMSSVFDSKFYKQGDAFTRIGYFNHNEKWHISYVSKTSEGYNNISGKKDYHETEYVTTSIFSDSVKPIPYDQQFDLHDILSIKAQNYHDSYWKDFNILMQNEALSRQIELFYNNVEAKYILDKSYPKRKSSRDIINKIVNNFSGDFGLAYLPFHSPETKFQIGYDSENGSTLSILKTLKRSNLSIALNSTFYFAFNKHVALYYGGLLYEIGDNQNFNTWDLGIRYRSLITSRGRPWFLDYGLGFSNGEYLLDLGITDNAVNGLKINGEKLNSDKIQVLIGKSYNGIKPNLSLRCKTGIHTEIFINGSYLFTLDTKDIVAFKEASGFFLTRKKVVLSADDVRMQLTTDNLQQKTTTVAIKSYQIVMGVNINL